MISFRSRVGIGGLSTGKGSRNRSRRDPFLPDDLWAVLVFRTGEFLLSRIVDGEGEDDPLRSRLEVERRRLDAETPAEIALIRSLREREFVGELGSCNVVGPCDKSAPEFSIMADREGILVFCGETGDLKDDGFWFVSLPLRFPAFAVTTEELGDTASLLLLSVAMGGAEVVLRRKGVADLGESTMKLAGLGGGAAGGSGGSLRFRFKARFGFLLLLVLLVVLPLLVGYSSSFFSSLGTEESSIPSRRILLSSWSDGALVFSRGRTLDKSRLPLLVVGVATTWGCGNRAFGDGGPSDRDPIGVENSSGSESVSLKVKGDDVRPACD